MKNPLHRMSKKMQKFVMLVAGGMSEKQACTKAYPPHPLMNPDVKLATLMANPKIQYAIHFMMKHKTNADVLAGSLSEIVNDPKAKPAQKLAAIKMLGQLGGHIKTGLEPEIAKRKNTLKAKSGDMQDEAFQAKMAELKKKAEGKNKVN